MLIWECNIVSYAASHHELGCVQRRRRAAAAGHIELSRAAGASGRGHRGELGDGAAVGIEAPSGAARRWLGPGEARRPSKALPNERGGDAAAARVGEHVRALLAAAIESRQGTRGGETRSVNGARSNFISRRNHDLESTK